MRLSLATHVTTVIIAACAAAASLPARAAQPRGGVESLRWLAGCWEQATPRGVIEEQWMRPAGGTLIGASRTVRRTPAGDSTTAYEFMRVFSRGGQLVFWAQPSGEPPAEFAAELQTDSSVTFANPAHDFPQRIRYARRGADSLVARIEGTRGGSVRGMDFPYRRVGCESPRGR